MPAFLLAIALAAVDIPRLTGRVVDTAGLLSPAESASLTAKLERIERDTSVQIVVAVVPTLDAEPMEDFGQRVAEAWRIGQKGLDNGVIVLVARDERQVRIEVGYGLEPVIPDGLAGRIIRDEIVPRFRQQDYGGGLDAAVDALARAARREYPAAEAEDGRDRRASPGAPFQEGAFNLFMAWFIWHLGVQFVQGTGTRFVWLASAILAAILLPGALLVSRWIGFALSPVFAALGLGLGALAGPFLVAARGRRRRSGRSWTSGGHYYGGSSGWGGSSLGGSSRGGFSGGFSGGGGRFGGGGASGKW
jgi:uncharacterized protein